MRRVILAGFYHETNGFSRARTDLDLFRAYQFVEGAEVIERYRGTGTEIGGMIAAAAAEGIELVPTLFASAVPAGMITAGCLAEIRARILAQMAAAGAYDAVAVVLHGAAAAEGVPDADGAILAAIRQAAGPDRPIVATTDFHANISAAMVDCADAIVGYRTYPHTDMDARGREAIAILARLLAGERLCRRHVKLPLLTVPQCQATEAEPMRAVMALRDRIATGEGIVSATVAMGFAYADCADLGASVIVHARTEAQADAAAGRLAQALWDRRAEFAPALIALDAVADLIGPDAATPVALLDPADNVGGGSAGDGTALLGALLDAGAQGAVVVICDPEAVRIAAAAGPGGAFDALVGGRADDLHGAPVRLCGRVSYLRDTSYRHSGSYMTGFVTRMGLTAIIEAGGVRVVLTSLRTMPFDIEQLRSVGIEPAEARVLVVKSAIAWRAAYGAVVRSVHTIDTPGICSSNLARLEYRQRPRPLYPLEPDAAFAADAGPGGGG